MTPRKGTAAALVAVAALVAAIAVSMTLRAPEPSLEARVQSVSAQLRCPTCVSQSVAESSSPMAESMRRTVRRQLAGGASEDQVVSWFRVRYGDGVVLRPRAAGLGVVLWAAPAVALLAGLALAAFAVRRSRRSPDGSGSRPPAPVPVRRLVGVGAVLALVGVGVPVLVGSGGTDDPPAASATAATRPGGAGATAPAGASGWAALARDLESRGSYLDAASAWQKAADRRPGSMDIRTRLAFDLLRGGRPGSAAETVAPAARTRGDHQQMALLVLGLARRDQGDPRADRTLRRFLRMAPDHPAAPEVRRLLQEDR